jgi:hypothetical protein
MSLGEAMARESVLATYRAVFSRRLALVFGVPLATLRLAGSAHADVVTLECITTNASPPPFHFLVAIDYEHNTVHQYGLTDDGIIDNRTWNLIENASISDKVITWVVRVDGGGGVNFTLGRYSGTLTEEPYGIPGSTRVELACHIWTPPPRTKKF